MIIYTKLQTMPKTSNKNDYFLDMNPTIKGDTMLSYGDMYPDVIFLSTVKCPSKLNEPNYAINNNEYFP